MPEALSPYMKERLEKWRKNTPKPKNILDTAKTSPGNFVPRNKDYGDDLNEFEVMKNKKTLEGKK